MVIRFECQHCKRPLAVREKHAGKRFKCPGCGQPAIVPELSPAKQDEPVESAVQAESAAQAESTREAEPEEESPPVRFGVKRDSRDSEEDLDMTPMVDVTFLLLIFFMVTAAFTLQKSIEVPPPDQEESAEQAQTLPELEEDDDLIIIRIARDNTIWVNDREAPSEQDLLVKLRDERGGSFLGRGKGPSSLLVLADRECLHETVVMALDAGYAVGMQNVSLATVDEDEL